MIAAFLALTIAATQPQTPPNAGAAEAKPTTVTSAGGATTLPANGSGSAPASYGDPANDDVAAPKLGPQQNLGVRINRTVHYITGDMIAPAVITDGYAGVTKGQKSRSYTGRAAFEIPVGQQDVYIGAEGRRYVYDTGAGVIGGIGRQARAYVPSFTAISYDVDVRGGFKVAGPRLYASVSYLTRGSNFELKERGLGYGIEKLADVDQNFSIHGGVWYYPNVGGAYTIAGTTIGGGISYRELRYLIGASFQAPGSPIFLDAGFLGDHGVVRTDAPFGFKHQGPYLGLGLRF